MTETIHFEGERAVVIGGASVENLNCGPIRTEPETPFDGAVMVERRKIKGSRAALPKFIDQYVDIDGVEWKVEAVSVVAEMSSVTFIRYLS